MVYFLWYIFINLCSINRILDNLAAFSDMLELNSSEKKAVFGFNRYALQLQDIDDKFKGQTFTVDLGPAEEAMKTEGNIRDSLATFEETMKVLENSTASVQLPANFSDSVQGCANESGPTNLLRLSYSVFLTDILFQSGQEGRGVGSIIVATRLGCAENSSLLNPLRVLFRTVGQVVTYTVGQE